MASSLKKLEREEGCSFRKKAFSWSLGEDEVEKMQDISHFLARFTQIEHPVDGGEEEEADGEEYQGDLIQASTLRAGIEQSVFGYVAKFPLVVEHVGIGIGKGSDVLC